MKELRREHKRGTLHANPSKLARVLGDINADVDATNKLEEDVDAKIDKLFEAKVAKLCETIAGILLRQVNAAHISLDRDLKKFSDTRKKARWKDYEKQAERFSDRKLADAAEAKRVGDIQTLRSDRRYSTFNPRKKIGAIEDAEKNRLTPSEAEAKLQAALGTQRRPSRSAWANHLGMAGYTIFARPTKHVVKTHITFT